MIVDPYTTRLANELLDAWGHGYQSAGAIEAELDALTGNRTTELLLAVQRERQGAPRQPITPARKLADPGSPWPVQRAGAPTPLRGARSILGDLVLVVAVVLPLVWLGVWWSTRGAAS